MSETENRNEVLEYRDDAAKSESTTGCEISVPMMRCEQFEELHVLDGTIIRTLHRFLSFFPF
jgi:hypothetical protein